MSRADGKWDTMPFGQPAYALALDSSGKGLRLPFDYVTPDMFMSGGYSSSGDHSIPVADALATGLPVLFGPRVYNVETIICPSRSVLMGFGHGVTQIKQIASVSADLLTLAANTTERVVIRGLMLNGNKANQSSANKGINFANTGSAADHIAASAIGSNDPRHLIEDVLVVDTKGNGVDLDGRGAGIYEKIWVYRADGVGFRTNQFDSMYGAIDIGASGLQGLLVDSGSYDGRFARVKAWFSGSVDPSLGYDYHLKGWYNTIEGIQGQDAKKSSLFLDGASFNKITGQLQSPGSVSAPADALVLYDSRKNIIDLTVRDRDGTPSMPYGVRFKSGASGNSYNDIRITVGDAQTADYIYENGAEKPLNRLVIGGVEI